MAMENQIPPTIPGPPYQFDVMAIATRMCLALNGIAKYAANFQEHGNGDPAQPMAQKDSEYPAPGHGPTIGEIRECQNAMLALLDASVTSTTAGN